MTHLMFVEFSIVYLLQDDYSFTMASLESSPIFPDTSAGSDFVHCSFAMQQMEL